jgi:NADH dehydrogenase FAD-containing subunit
MIHHQVLRKFGIKHSKYAIVGGGLAGIGIAGRLAANKNFMRHDITIFENSNFVYYKPGWTLVASGLMDIDKVRQPIA